MIASPLTEGWTLTPVAGPVPDGIPAVLAAEVPGSAHTDLLRAGHIADPYLDGNEKDLTWMHHVDWRYDLPLTLPAAAADERVDLVLDGVDTVSRIRLGGRELGTTANMHRSYRFNIRPEANGTPRQLSVDLRSATAYAEELRGLLGDRPSAYHPVPFNFVRKMACSFGWDWGPDLRTAGLWKEVRIERWTVARLAEVRPLVTVTPNGAGRVEVHVTIERSGLENAADLTLEASVLGQTATAVVPAESSSAVLTLNVPDAPLWWPAGYGDQPLSGLQVRLLGGSAGAVLHSWDRRIGFRSIELDTSRDETGTAFTLKVNGKAVFVKGANWIPDDHLLTRITRARLDRRLDQALAANLNLLRVWGGGIYETEDFYTACDERGILVWQDFLLACAAYPEESPLWEEFESEARENVVRLAPHPSLVLWNGGNENVWGHEDWGWKEELAGLSWGSRYAHELLGGIVAELDPTRPYCDNSPYSPGEDPGDVHPNDPDHGTHHQWEVWNRIDYSAYRDEVPRFCSEFGFQGPPAWRTLTDYVHASDGGPLAGAPDPKEDPVFLVHQKADDGNGKLDRGLAPHLGVPADFEDWHWATQLNQARAVRYAVEHYRSWWPRTAGAIVWQLNDCWPVTSWAAIDSQERPKPLWHALRLANAPRIVSFGSREKELSVSLVNDTDQPWSGPLILRRETLDGAVKTERTEQVEVAARSVKTIPVGTGLSLSEDPQGEVLLASLGAERAIHTFVEDIDLRLDPNPLKATAEPVPGGYEVKVYAASLARDITLHVDRVDPGARVDDGLITLPAGGEWTFTVISTAAGIDPEEFVSRSVLRTANDLRAVPALTGAGHSTAATQ
ncbi:glycoside hydrolase family 2 protein [Pseudarthrobacter sp. B4EP4b]|uniref:glycoside hydrolase family 2 protein n=1 Tax=Pseudarthrobacter sp. B4EP4b TaxID=2590664 RepID=UPI00115473CB|nr:glycoside hydrolase family 2 protein [Pseudarthrobacter sp. B4EP4b]